MHYRFLFIFLWIATFLSQGINANPIPVSGIISDLGNLIIVGNPSLRAPILIVNDIEKNSFVSDMVKPDSKMVNPQWLIPRDALLNETNDFSAQFVNPITKIKQDYHVRVLTPAKLEGNVIVLNVEGDIVSFNANICSDISALPPVSQQNSNGLEEESASGDSEVRENGQQEIGDHEAVVPSGTFVENHAKILKIVGISTVAAMITALAIKIYNKKRPEKKISIVQYSAIAWGTTALTTMVWYYWPEIARCFQS